MSSMEAADTYKPTITISSKDYPDLPNLRLDDEGEITLQFEVVGLNKYDDETFEGEVNNCTLEYRVKSMSVKKVSLEDAADKAGRKATEDSYVKTQTTPAP